jgi:hypothetical protein
MFIIFKPIKLTHTMTDTGFGQILEKLNKDMIKNILTILEQKPEKEKTDMIDQIVDFAFDV